MKTLAEQSKIARENYYTWKEIVLEGQPYRIGSRNSRPQVIDIKRGDVWDKMSVDEVNVYVRRVVKNIRDKGL